MVVTLSFTEGDFEDLDAHNTLEETWSFASGFRRGAMKYGAGSVRVFVMPDEAEYLQAYDCEGRAKAQEAYALWSATRSP